MRYETPRELMKRVLPKYIFQSFERNMNVPYEGIHNIKSVGSILSAAFTWQHTSQGHKYWWEIVQKYGHHKPLPIWMCRVVGFFNRLF